MVSTIRMRPPQQGQGGSAVANGVVSSTAPGLMDHSRGFLGFVPAKVRIAT
jgi:hypothetical protein